MAFKVIIGLIYFVKLLKGYSNILFILFLFAIRSMSNMKAKVIQQLFAYASLKYSFLVGIKIDTNNT